jgi:hypothetical protein
MQTRSVASTPALLIVLTLFLAACGPAVSPPPATPATTPAPSLDLPISTGEAAMAAVAAADPRFAAIQPRDLDLIGQSAWWEARPASGVGAFVVTIRIGWGDCQAGCIDEHQWTFAVTPDGGVRLLSEDGPPVPVDEMPGGGAGRTGAGGHATAGPVCPVETNPPDPACAPRPVVGARVVALDASGAVVAEMRTDDAGGFAFDLPAGAYTIQADPVDGLMGVPAPLAVTVIDGAMTSVDLAYDTGIR